MRLRAVFGEAFLDGFTMAGLGKLRSPASPDALFAPEDDEEPSRVVAFAVEGPGSGKVRVRGDLRQIPLSALDGILRAVAAERRNRSSEEPIAGVSNG